MVKSFFVGYLIMIFYFTFCLICLFFIASLIGQKTIIKKIRINNNIIELFNSYNEAKTYELDKINIRYNRFIYHPRGWARKGIHIYFNDDRYTTDEFEHKIYDFEPYIGFIILANLLKTNEIKNIENVKDEDIEKLQQKFTYSEE